MKTVYQNDNLRFVDNEQDYDFVGWLENLSGNTIIVIFEAPDPDFNEETQEVFWDEDTWQVEEIKVFTINAAVEDFRQYVEENRSFGIAIPYIEFEPSKSGGFLADNKGRCMFNALKKYFEDETEIENRIKDAIGEPGTECYKRFLGFAAAKDIPAKALKNRDTMARWLKEAPADIKQDFLDEFNEESNDLRICTHCGRFMFKGYLLDCDYACSDTCAIALYDGDEEQLREDIRASVEEDDGDYFWTEW